MRLHSLPASFSQTRRALHQIAFFALAPARYRAVGRMGLRPAPGGFGTPRFDGRVLRVEGATIVSEEPDRVASQTITTIRAATAFAGVDYEVAWFGDFHDPLEPMDPDADLHVDDASTRALGQWFNFGHDILEVFRDQASADEAASEVQLWPEHFDLATEVGDEDGNRRASYGASPGDGAHPDPYIYVAAWGEIDRSNAYWNDESFEGASLPHSSLASSSDPAGLALEFLAEGHRVLHAP